MADVADIGAGAGAGDLVFELPEAGFDISRALVWARKRFGKPVGAQVADIARLAFGPGKLSAREYYDFHLCDDARLSADDKRRFLGRKMQDKIIAQVVPLDWWATAHDKIVFYALMAGHGLPVPATRALYHPFRRLGPAAPLADTAALGNWLRRDAAYPFFAKPVSGMFSIGSFEVTGYDAASDALELTGQAAMPVDEFCRQIAQADGGYLFQEVLDGHPELNGVCAGRVSTARLVILMEKDGPELFRSLWKIPSGTNVADNFWRDGNMMAAIDDDSGRVERVVRGHGPDQVEIDTHPETGAPLKGFVLPDWERVRDLCFTAATALPGLKLQAWDIALCPDGPVVMEVNIGGSFNLPQIASGSGLMDARFTRFIADACAS